MTAIRRRIRVLRSPAVITPSLLRSSAMYSSRPRSYDFRAVEEDQDHAESRNIKITIGSAVIVQLKHRDGRPDLILRTRSR